MADRNKEVTKHQIREGLRTVCSLITSAEPVAAGGAGNIGTPVLEYLYGRSVLSNIAVVKILTGHTFQRIFSGKRRFTAI
jgi:hypothetical protein